MFSQTQTLRRMVRAAFCFRWLWVTICASSCVPPSLYVTSPGRLGIIEVSGPEVYVDGRQGRSGDEIFDGAHVSTGLGSSARIRFADGGFCQLDENTDPWFSIGRDPVTGKKCLHVRVGFGQIYMYKHDVCFDTPDVAGIMNSKANFKITGDQETIIALIEGGAHIHRPAGLILTSKQLAVFSKGNIVEGPRMMSDKEIREIPSWIHRFHFPNIPTSDQGWCCAYGKLSQTSRQDCERNHGFFSHDRNEAMQKCQRLGWCCLQGNVFETTQDKCARRQGFFSLDRNEAIQKCQRLGWCCVDGNVFETTQDQCARRKGFFSLNRKEAQRKCSPLE